MVSNTNPDELFTAGGKLLGIVVCHFICTENIELGKLLPVLREGNYADRCYNSDQNCRNQDNGQCLVKLPLSFREEFFFERRLNLLKGNGKCLILRQACSSDDGNYHHENGKDYQRDDNRIQTDSKRRIVQKQTN